MKNYTVKRKNDAGDVVDVVELVTPSLSAACALARKKERADAARYGGSTVKMAGNFWTVEDAAGNFYNPQSQRRPERSTELQPHP